MTSRVYAAIFVALLSVVSCQAQQSKTGRLERVNVMDELRKPGFSPLLLIGKTFNARDVDYTSLGEDPMGVFIPYVFDEDSSRICGVVLGRKLSEAEKVTVSTEDQRNDSLIVDVFVIHKKKLFVIVDPLLTKREGGKRWEGVDNMLGISEYNKRQEIVFDRYVVPDFMFRFGDGSDKIERVANFNGRIFRDSSFR